MSTLVVSWKLAAEMKLELCTEALVIPSNWVLAEEGFGRPPLAGSPPKASIWALTCSNVSLGTMVPISKSLSPFSVIRTHFCSSSFVDRNSNLSMTIPGRRLVSPGFSIRTFRNMRATMISICLSLISTRWLRYTF